MTVVLVTSQPEELRNLLPWAWSFSTARETDLALVLAQRGTGDSVFRPLPVAAVAGESEMVTQARDAVAGLVAPDVRTAASAPENPSPTNAVDATPDDSGDVSLLPRLFQMSGEKWEADLKGNLAELSPDLVILPAPVIARDESEADSWQMRVLADLECEVILLRDDAVHFKKQIRVAMVLSQQDDATTALSHGHQLVQKFGGVPTAVYVEPNFGDFSKPVGEQHLQGLLKEAFSRTDRELFHHQVVVANSVAEAVSALDLNNFDLLLFAATDQREMRRVLRITPRVDDGQPLPAIGVIRTSVPLADRLWKRADRWIQSFVPQLTREDRIRLVSRIRDSSQWDFDFIFLISLSTLIACFGLAENSGAVIVGAMLVAPLMTPIAGVGLGVAHANSILTKVALRTAIRGFATAMGIGIVFGLCVQFVAETGWLTPLLSDGQSASLFPAEMENRTQPQFYDLLIALASGVAAAYAMGRPNLFSALPGVAIAAALVPPIATSGIAFAHREFIRGGGALLLFVTNMVTIILGTSLVFRAVGIRPQQEGPAAARWPRYVLLALVILSLLVTFAIELHRGSLRQ